MNISKTTTVTVPAIGCTVQDLINFLGPLDTTATVRFRSHEGDRPYDRGYTTITVTEAG